MSRRREISYLRGLGEDRGNPVPFAPPSELAGGMATPPPPSGCAGGSSRAPRRLLRPAALPRSRPATIARRRPTSGGSPCGLRSGTPLVQEFPARSGPLSKSDPVAGEWRLRARGEMCPQDVPECRNTITPSDLLSFSVSAPVIADWHLVDAGPHLCEPGH